MKLRIRTEKELQRQGRLLAAVRDVVKKCGITPLVTGGTLLGIIREKDFIAWDWDAELFVKYDEVKDKDIATELKKQGLKVAKINTHEKAWKINVGFDKGYVVEIRAWYKDKDLYRRKGYNVPCKFIKETREVTLRGETYTAPKDCEGFLTHVYGDWQTPKRTSDQAVYLSKQFTA